MIRILDQYPAEREYLQFPQVNWHEWDANPGSRIPLIFDRANLARRTDVVSIDLSQEDLQHLRDWVAAHNSAVRDPRVQDAWQQYRTMLHMTQNTGADG